MNSNSYQQIEIIKRGKLLGIHLEGKQNFDFYINSLQKLAKNVTLLEEFAIT